MKNFINIIFLNIFFIKNSIGENHQIINKIIEKNIDIKNNHKFIKTSINKIKINQVYHYKNLNLWKYLCILIGNGFCCLGYILCFEFQSFEKNKFLFIFDFYTLHLKIKYRIIYHIFNNNYAIYKNNINIIRNSKIISFIGSIVLQHIIPLILIVISLKKFKRKKISKKNFFNKYSLAQKIYNTINVISIGFSIIHRLLCIFSIYYLFDNVKKSWNIDIKKKISLLLHIIFTIIILFYSIIYLYKSIINNKNINLQNIVINGFNIICLLFYLSSFIRFFKVFNKQLYSLFYYLNNSYYEEFRHFILFVIIQLVLPMIILIYNYKQKNYQIKNNINKNYNSFNIINNITMVCCFIHCLFFIYNTYKNFFDIIDIFNDNSYLDDENNDIPTEFKEKVSLAIYIIFQLIIIILTTIYFFKLFKQRFIY